MSKSNGSDGSNGSNGSGLDSTRSNPDKETLQHLLDDALIVLEEQMSNGMGEKVPAKLKTPNNLGGSNGSNGSNENKLILSPKKCHNKNPDEGDKQCTHCGAGCTSDDCRNECCEIFGSNGNKRWVCMCPGTSCKCAGRSPTLKEYNEHLIEVYLEDLPVLQLV